MEDFPADDGSSEMDRGKDPLQPEGVGVVEKYESGGGIRKCPALWLGIVKHKPGIGAT